MALSLPASAQTTDYGAAIDAERLAGADTENESWLSYGRTYDEQRIVHWTKSIVTPSTSLD